MPQKLTGWRPAMLSTVGMLAAVLLPVAAQAGTFTTVLRGLSEAGFNFVAERNFMSGGSDWFVSRTFTGETLDFGATELTLQGTPTFTMSTGGRGLDLFEFSLNTGGSPFNYQLTTDTGNQITTLNGSFLLDATGKINQFGYYDVTFNASSRQTFNNEGRFSNDPLTEDFDIGPVDIRGNIFADVLAVITEPIFNALGVDNIFAQFSASGQLGAKLSAQVAKLQEKARSGQMLSAEEIAELGSAMSLAAAFGVPTPDIGFLADLDLATIMHPDPLAESAVNRQIVPEPATVLLLIAAVPYLLRRWRGH